MLDEVAGLLPGEADSREGVLGLRHTLLYRWGTRPGLVARELSRSLPSHVAGCSLFLTTAHPTLPPPILRAEELSAF